MPEIKVIGIRHGEKMAETLLTAEERIKAVDEGRFFRVPADNRDLNYDKYFTVGSARDDSVTTFNSDNTTQLDVEGVKEKLLKLPYIHERLKEFGLE